MAKQQVNYILHLKNVNQKFYDSDINPNHISLYNALFQLWNNCGFEDRLSINRNDVMLLSKIGSPNTYVKCLRDLENLGFINYFPSKNPIKGSIVNMVKFDTSLDIVLTKFCTSTDTCLDTLSKQENLLTNKQENNINVGQATTAKDFIDSTGIMPEKQKMNTLPENIGLIEIVDYLKKIKNKNFKYLPKLQSQLNARIKEGYTVSEIKLASWNCFNNSFHKLPENSHFLTPEFILTSKNLEKYLNVGGVIPEDKPKQIEKKDYPNMIDWYVARIEAGESEKTLVTSDQSFDWINQANEIIRCKTK